MQRKIKNISLYVTCDGDEHIINTYPNEYRNLMMLIYDKVFIEDFGDCLGMGKCGTCIIEIEDSSADLSSFDRNEQTTLKRAGEQNFNSRLSCQILVDEKLNALKLKVKR